MSLENPNNKQNELSEDGEGEMNEMHPTNNKNLDTESIITQYDKKLIELSPIALEIGNYIEAKENIDETQYQFDKLNSGSQHVNQSKLREVHNLLNRYQRIIADYEKSNHAPEEGGLDIERSKLEEVESEMENLRKLKDQFNPYSKTYENN